MTEEAEPPVGAEVAVFPPPTERPGVVSDRRIMAAARRLRAVSIALEWLIFLLIVGSVAAIGSIQPWAYIPLWYSAPVLIGLVGLRT